MIVRILRSTVHILKRPACTNSNVYYSTTVGMNMTNVGAIVGLPVTDIVKALLSFAPLTLAENWDNVGLLVDPMRSTNVKKILLTNDLTEDVIDEAIKIKAGFIVTYHPIIFQGLKSICASSSWKERVVVKCIKNEIAVFSPHTSWDCTEQGVNHWLASAFQFQTIVPIKIYGDCPSKGAGRFLVLETPMTVQQVIDKIKEHVGVKHLRLALANNGSVESSVSSVALCAGSGSSVLKGTKADLYLTGEMSHHEVLEASQNGIHVILCEHSNSERGFLNLFQKHLKSKLLGDTVDVVISVVDKDPLVIV